MAKKNKHYRKTPQALKKHLANFCIDNAAGPCIIDVNKKTHSGSCVLTHHGYPCKCFYKNGSTYTPCSKNDIIRNQGFPINYKFSEVKTQRHKELGHSFPATAAFKIATEMKNKVVD